MSADNSQSGSRMVEPQRKRKRGPSDRRREARRLVERIEQARRDRRVAWPEGQPEFAAEHQEQRLSTLHADKRAMRRDIYREAPELEGHPVFKGQPGGRQA